MANSSLRRSKTVGLATSIQLSNLLGKASSSIQLSHSMGREPSEASRQLLCKVREGDAIAVEFLLDQPPEALVDINARGERQMTPLHLAAENNHQNLLQKLLAGKLIDLNAQDDHGRTALIIAAQEGLPKLAQMLQEAGANVLLCAQGGYTALHVAACYGHLEVVNQLLGISATGEIDQRDGDFTFPQETTYKPSKSVHSSKDLHSPRAMTRKFFKRSPECGGSQADRHCKLFSGKSGGSQGVSRQCKPSSTQFKAVTPVNGDSGDIPQEFPKFQPSETAVLKMLEAKTSAELCTPLHLAAAKGYHEVVLFLIQAYGQAVGITEAFDSILERGGREALNMARVSIMQILNSQDDTASTEEANKSGVLDKALGRILFPGSDLSISWSTVDAMASYVNAKDCIGRTPLHHATWEQHDGVVEKLLELFIVNVNAADMDGFTPLHLGAWKGSEKVVELLVAHDAKHQTLNPNLRARQNRSTWAKILEVKRLQQKLGTLLSAINLQDFFFSEERDGMTPLHYAVEENHEGIVGALAGHSEINVFAMASPPTNSSVMEALAAAEDEREKGYTPLSLAFSTQNSAVFLKLLKSGKRKKIMQELHMLRGYLSQSSKFEGNKKAVKDYHRDLLKSAVSLIRLDSRIIENDLFSNLERELGVALNTLLHKSDKNKYTLLHHAAFAGLGTELEVLLSVPAVAKDINTGDIDDQTALHFATMEDEIAAVKVLMNDMTLKPNEEDHHNRTALQLAFEKGSRDIISLLMGCPDVKLAVEKLYKERAVNDNAANAIIVVAALIASVTFAGWLQPPLGFTQYTGLTTSNNSFAPMGTPSYAALEVPAVRYFWIFNSLSFYLAMATVISGAAEVLPMRDAFIGQEVRMVRGGLMRTSMLLVLSVICVLAAFAAAGFACLPPISKYTRMMVWSTYSGLSVCFSMLSIFWFRMGSMLVRRDGNRQIKWMRFKEADLTALPFGRILWLLFKVFGFIPENYSRFQSTRTDEDSQTCKRKLFFYLVKVFKLDREEYWRYHVK